MRLSGTPRSARVGVFAVTGVLLLAGLSGCSGVGSGAASCAAAIEYDGHTYLGTGNVRRDPEVTGRSMPAVLPGCDDSGGQSEPEGDEAIRVEELADVDSGVSVMFNGSVYVRNGQNLPHWTQRWFRAPRCDTDGTFRLSGGWLGVTGPHKPRFDGDIQVPYRLEVHVTSGPPDYVATTIFVRATSSTDPALDAADVTTSLLKGGQVSASVRCAGGRFEAVALRAG
ncbi:DUF6281 family protein [Nocardioides sp.]|uniref:DUF6281 family protein n=1 Tax=Nocardioides sp. TaxID=35761 RepID=UPI003D138866